MLKVSNVKVSLKQAQKEPAKILASYLNVREKSLSQVTLLKRSIDARKGKVHYICTYAFSYPDEEELMQKQKQVSVYQPYHYPIPKPINKTTIVVGSGPAGLFCTWLLAKSGSPVILLERGSCVEKRIQAVDTFFETGLLNERSNVQFGEGGAGTFSDGKLTTGIKDPRVTQVLKTFVEYGAPEDILYEAKPHIGTDYLRKLLINMRYDLLAMGAIIRFESQVTDVLIENGRVQGVEINHQEKLLADAVVLAIGHSARDTFEMLYQRKVPMEAKPFAVGVRIEHPQTQINTVQYGEHASQLKPASYKLSYHAADGRGVYTFCMCPGGQVVAAASEKERLVTNGMSEYARAKANANSAVLVNVGTADFGSDHPLAGMYYQRELEGRAFRLGQGHYHAPVSLLQDYMKHQLSSGLGKIEPSYQPGWQFANLHQLFSEAMNDDLKAGLAYFGTRLKEFDRPDAILTGVESRSSSPVRLVRDGTLSSAIAGLYPCGEGAGYAGGIMSAAVDGLKVAEIILGGSK